MNQFLKLISSLIGNGKKRLSKEFNTRGELGELEDKNGDWRDGSGYEQALFL